ncbi:MAG: hypothetical protein JJU29_01845 [Verrucomicrobia bacterium]|nr:hypothetical protein [Verrucomicrobiota bacterium]MCH8510975.1 hypothetical protein [Kiritimatiellia bacterium]
MMLVAVEGGGGNVWECPACGRRAPAIRGQSDEKYKAEDDVAFRSALLDTCVCPDCGDQDYKFLRGDIVECLRCNRRQFLSMYLATDGIELTREWANWSHKGTICISDTHSGVRRLRPSPDGRRFAAVLDDDTLFHCESLWVDSNTPWHMTRAKFNHVCDVGWARNGHLVVLDTPGQGLLEFGNDFVLVDQQPVNRLVNVLFNDADGSLFLAGVDMHNHMSVSRYELPEQPVFTSDDFYTGLLSVGQTSPRCGQDLMVLDLGHGLVNCRMRACRQGLSGAIWRGQQGAVCVKASDLAVNQRADWIAVADKGQKKLHVVDMAGCAKDSVNLPFASSTLCFSGDGRSLILGDANKPALHFYERKSEYVVAKKPKRDHKMEEK